MTGKYAERAREILDPISSAETVDWFSELNEELQVERARLSELEGE